MQNLQGHWQNQIGFKTFHDAKTGKWDLKRWISIHLWEKSKLNR